MANMKTKFMALWDGFSTDPNARVMVLAATNRSSEFDEPIMRRLPQAFEIGMPERKERAEILKADIFELCKKAAYFPIREILEEERKWRPCPVAIILFVRYLGHCHSWIWRKFLLRRRRRKLQQASIVD
ncbi:hypothetical protein YC2023_044631 [Brassica napus]